MLLKQKKAKIIDYKPFTILLLYGSRGHTQKTTVGIDLGEKHQGIAVESEEKILTDDRRESIRSSYDLLNITVAS